jgi:hypothetical protein
MYIIPPVHELAIVGVFDPGIPNRERIVLRPTEAVNLAAFGLLLSVTGDGGGVFPISDQFFWFGGRWITPPCWLVVFTGPGQYNEGMHETSGEPVLEFHWAKRAVVLGEKNISVSVIRLGGISSFQPSIPPVSAIAKSLKKVEPNKV